MVQRLNRLPVVPARVLLIGALLLGTLLGILHSEQASAQTHTYNVTSTADLSDATPGDDACLTSTNVCTLRAAIEEANHPNNTGTKFITVYLPGTYTLGSQLVITGTNINIYGTGDPRDVIIDGGSVHRVFDIGGGTVNIAWLTLRGGRNEQSVVVPSHYHGGAIHNHGTLTLGEVIIEDSVSGDVTGGTADCITVCGGGLYNANTATLDDVTFDTNSAKLNGGAIHNGGTLTATNSTLHGNAAELGTGAAVSNAGTATMLHTTVAWNITGTGTAIAVLGGTLTLTASIASNNVSALGACGGTVTDGGFNISWDQDASVLDTSCPGVNEDPLLDPARLQDNGGTTPTIELMPGSAAIDLIPSGTCTVTTDQRGVTRPSGAGCDVGAFEYVDTVAPTLVVSNVTANATSPAGALVNYQATVSDDITPSNQIVVVCKNAHGVVVPSGSLFPVGTTTVTCTATDKSGNATQASFTVTVRGAANLLALLRADTITLVGNISAERGMVSIIDLAQLQVSKGNPFGAYASMIAYAYQVSRYNSAGVITPAVAAQLLAEAGLVFNALL